MPLLDHFRPPLYPKHPFESCHTRWATAIADALDRTLPSRYFATVQTHLGSRVEADVAKFEGPDQAASGSPNGSGGVAVQTWSPPAPALVMPAAFPDQWEVQIRDERDDARLVAVVELVSPSNLDRPETRCGFVGKCVAYLQRGIGLIVVDVVTVHHFNLHNELVASLTLPDTFAMAAEVHLYAVAYRPVHREDRNQIEVWPVPLTVGGVLPVLPLALRGAGVVPLDLEGTYSEVRLRSRL